MKRKSTTGSVVLRVSSSIIEKDCLVLANHLAVIPSQQSFVRAVHVGLKVGSVRVMVNVLTDEPNGTIHQEKLHSTWVRAAEATATLNTVSAIQRTFTRSASFDETTVRIIASASFHHEHNTRTELKT